MNDTVTRSPSPSRTAARALGVDESCLVAIERRLNQPEFLALGYVVARAVDDHPERVLSRATGAGVATRTLTATAEGDRLVLDDALVLMPAGTVTDHEVVLRLLHEDWSFGVHAYARQEQTEAMVTGLEAFVQHAIGPGSPFRGGSFQVFAGSYGIVLDHWQPGSVTRADLMLPDAVWQTVDRQVHGALDLADVLAAEGLAASTGVLCVGPPGTGKSQLARIVAAELAGRATVLVPNAAAARRYVRPLLRLATRLAPSFVVLDDLDLAVGSRRGGGESESLQDFLTSMDDAMSTAGGVVVMASTNDPRSIDPAAVRASRFDSVIEMTAPGYEARVRVLRRHFSRFPDLDVARIASATHGATGADLRDLARRSYLHSRGQVTTAAVLACVEDGKWASNLTEGAYL